MLILATTIAGGVSISEFSSLVYVPAGITSSTVGINIFAITAGIKNYKTIIKKKNKRHYKIVFLGKDKLNTIEVLISESLIDSHIHM